MRRYALYIHIPYCKSRCRYCDFHTQGGAEAVPGDYIAALLRDFARYAPPVGEAAVGSVYFGGGTPGLLSPGQVAELLAAFAPAPGAEITLEANPDSADPARLAGWRAAGVGRLSFGVQSARDASLRLLGRRHTAARARQAFAEARAAGFENISGDIMLALPGYSEAEFDETLDLMEQGGATHLSAYLLKLEPGTPLAAARPAGLPDADRAADLYLYAVSRMQARGYQQYEISNFARAGFAGRHNLVYWDAGDYLGLGPGAHSSLGGRRFSFGRDTAAFLRDALPPREEGLLTADDYLMLRLRLAEGINEEALKARFGRALSAGQQRFFEKLCAEGLAKAVAGGYALTPEGMLVQNAILTSLPGFGQ